MNLLFRFCLFGCCAVLFASGVSAEEKLDVGIEADPDARYPVFVRFQKQFFKKAGDYETFTQQPENQLRSQLRKKVITALKSHHQASWKAVEPDIQALETAGDLRAVERYWIVNGFAAVANFAACEKLASLAEVEFVYHQRGNARLHQLNRPAVPQPRLAQMQGIYQEVLKDFRDDSNDPFSVDGLEIPWNISRIKADDAWKAGATGKGVVIGLMDSGLMVTPALTSALWKNPGETLNGKDDDGNGYVDDLFGYDFNANSFYALGDGTRVTHGSMCGGILVSRPLNKLKLATGVAPRAKLMVLRGMGLLKTYEYAFENGADIISMSYMLTQPNLGNFRGVYRLAHEHMAAGGVVSVGGAGNFAAGPRRLPEGRQIALPKDIPCVITAAGITEAGTAPPFSSRGPVQWAGVKFYNDSTKEKPLQKPDVTGCIGGYPVWGRPVRRGANWKIVSQETNAIALVTGPQGNSFSGPHAGGVAALMLSINPDLPPWQIKSMMQSTCTDLGKPGWDTTYGHGLLNAAAAVEAAKKSLKP